MSSPARQAKTGARSHEQLTRTARLVTRTARGPVTRTACHLLNRTRLRHTSEHSLALKANQNTDSETKSPNLRIARGVVVETAASLAQAFEEPKRG